MRAMFAVGKASTREVSGHHTSTNMLVVPSRLARPGSAASLPARVSRTCWPDGTPSATRSAIRIASSDTTMVSGNCTSRTIFSAFWPKPIAFCRAFSCLRFIAASER